MPKTKKQKIIDMINEAFTLSSGIKTLTKDYIHSHGFYVVEGGDLPYITKVANSLGYYSRTGICLHLYPKEEYPYMKRREK